MSTMRKSREAALGVRWIVPALLLLLAAVPPGISRATEAPRPPAPPRDDAAAAEEREADDGAFTPADVTGDPWAARLAELTAELSSRLTSPRAAATLYRIQRLESKLPSLAPLARVYARVADDDRVHPEVRGLARYLLAETEMARGRVARARQHLDRLSFARDGWIAGGFDNEGGRGHDTPFPPEQGSLDLGATYAGKERDVNWRRAPPPGPRGAIPVHELLRPRKNSTFYFLTTLEAASSTRAVLHLGTSGATKLWINGQLALADETDHPARFDQRAVSVPLRKGANLVLLKVSVLEERPAIFLRLSGPAGRAPSGVAFRAPEKGSPVAATAFAPGSREAAAAEKPGPAEDLVTTLAKLVAASPQDGALREDHALLLAERRAFDSKQQRHRREQERAAELQPRSARTQLVLAEYQLDDHNRRRRALERALALDPKLAPARVALSAYYLERGFARRAHDEAERAVAAAPKDHAAILAHADTLAALGLGSRAQATVLRLAERFPTSPEVILQAARNERALGRVREAIARYRVLLSLRFDHPARSELVSLLAASGDVAGAAAELERSLQLEPASVSSALRLASLLSHNGREEDARALYDRLAAASPDEDAVFEARGQHRLRAGDQTGALADFNAALALRPQNARLRELVRAVLPQENFAAPHLRDAVALAAKAREGLPPALVAGADAVGLASLDVVRVHPNGLSSRVRQEVTLVLTDRGVEQARVTGIRYTPGAQEVRIEQARVIKPDGTVLEAKQESDRALTEPWAGMYFDARHRTVAFQDVRPGDVVEVTYRLDDVSTENMFADYFGDVVFLQSTTPQRDVEYVLIAPASRRFYTNQPRLEGVRHVVDEPDASTRVWRWAASDVPRVLPEPGMPGWADIAPYLHISTFREWDEVARFWWGLIRDQIHATPEVRAAAEEAVRGIPASDVRGRVRAVYDYVITKTRYVGLEFGIHGFKPYRVDQVLARRFGDCKDKASLMYAMLEHLGIPSRLVLLRMRDLGHLAEFPASLAVFNHAILYVPQLDLYLDGTAEFAGSEELPMSDQGAQALIVEEGRGRSRFVVTPIHGVERNLTKNALTFTVRADGSARVEGSSEIRGQAASGYRKAYQSESGRRERFEQSYARSYPGAKVAALEMSAARALEEPVRLSFQLEVPQVARKEGDLLVLSPFGEPFRYSPSLASLSKRVFPVEVGHPQRNEHEVELTLPGDYVLADGPVRFEKRTRFGEYFLSVEEVAGAPERAPAGEKVAERVADKVAAATKTPPRRIRVTARLALSVERVSPEDYPAFRAFLEDLDRTLSRPLRLSTATRPMVVETPR